MAFQVVGKGFGYRLGWLSRNQKRNYIRVNGGQIETTLKVEESGLFTWAECLELLAQIIGKSKHQYFIFEDEVFLYGQDEISSEVRHAES